MADVCTHPKWIIDKDNVGTCANPDCGEVRQFPWEKGGEVIVLRESKLKTNNNTTKGKSKPGKKDNYTRHYFYEQNRSDITADLLTYGRSFTRRKWGIPSSSLHSLEKSWFSKEQLEQIEKASTDTIHSLQNKNNERPTLPPFNDNWETPVQVKWLEIYEKLFSRSYRT